MPKISADETSRAKVIGALTLGVAVLALGIFRTQVFIANRTQRRLANDVFLMGLGILAWPLIWVYICTDATVEALPYLTYLGLLWPPLLLMLDVANIEHQVEDHTEKKNAALQAEASGLISLGLTIGGLLVRHVSDAFGTAATPLFTAGILMALLVVIPSPNIHAKSSQAEMLVAIRKIAISYTIGLLITSISLTFAIGLSQKWKQKSALADVWKRTSR